MKVVVEANTLASFSIDWFLHCNDYCRAGTEKKKKHVGDRMQLTSSFTSFFCCLVGRSGYWTAI